MLYKFKWPLMGICIGMIAETVSDASVDNNKVEDSPLFNIALLLKMIGLAVAFWKLLWIEDERKQVS